MFAGKTLTGYASLPSPDDFVKLDSIILKYFKDEWKQFQRNNWSNKFNQSNKIQILMKSVRYKTILTKNLKKD